MPKILIVEDDKNYLWILRQSFVSENISVVFAVDGEDAVKMAAEEKPDLILLDIMLPKIDGIEAAKQIKAKGIVAPIIFLTNFNDAEHVSGAMEAVKDTEYIVKSNTHINEIVSRVKNKLGI